MFLESDNARLHTQWRREYPHDETKHSALALWPRPRRETTLNPTVSTTPLMITNLLCLSRRPGLD